MSLWQQRFRDIRTLMERKRDRDASSRELCRFPGSQDGTLDIDEFEIGEIIGEFALKISRRLGYEPELNGHSAYK